MSDPNRPYRDEPITYVLAGYDREGSMTPNVEAYRRQKNVIVLSVDQYPSLDEALKQIRTPGNVVVACHGEVVEEKDGSLRATGRFTWNKNKTQGTLYSDLFKKLPSGLDIAILLNCLGESAFSMLNDLPAGTLLLPLTNSVATNSGAIIDHFQKETLGIQDSTALILEAFDNVDPNLVSPYRKTYAANQVTHVQDIMPTRIGIGGNPPIKIDLNEISKNLRITTLRDEENLKKAVELVVEHFDVKQARIITKVLKDEFSVDVGSYDMTNEKDQHRFQKAVASAMHKRFPEEADKTPSPLEKFVASYTMEAFKELHEKIDLAVSKMRNQEAITVKDGIPDYDETRIRRAIGIAYLKTSGQLGKMIDEAKKSVQEKDEHAALLDQHGLSKQQLAQVILPAETTTYVSHKAPTSKTPSRT